MHISIKYCGMWNYKPKAAGLADTIKKAIDVDCELIEGSGGIFDVKVDGDLIFSKHEVGRFPEDSEILDQLQSR